MKRYPKFLFTDILLLLSTSLLLLIFFFVLAYRNHNLSVNNLPIQTLSSSETGLSEEDTKKLVTLIASTTIDNKHSEQFFQHTLAHPFTTESTNSTLVKTNDTMIKRCSYHDQDYVVGDIIKTDQSWLRCTPVNDKTIWKAIK